MNNMNIVTLTEAKELKTLGFTEKTYHNYYTSNVTGGIKLEESSVLANWNNDIGKFESRKDRKWSAPTTEQRNTFLESIR